MNQEALKLMQMPGELKLSANGVWFHADTEVTHPKIASYFFRHLDFDSKLNSFVIEQNGRCVKVKVEDTPQFVRTITFENSQANALLSNQQELTIGPKSLSFNPETAVYYARFANFRARLLKPALQALIPLIKEIDSEYYLELANKQLLISIEQDD